MLDQTYTITDAAKTYQIPAFLPDPFFCDVTYSASYDNMMAIMLIGFDAASRTFTFSLQNNLMMLDNVESSDVVVTVRALAGTMIPVLASGQFTLTIENPCFKSDYISIVSDSTIPESILYNMYEG